MGIISRAMGVASNVDVSKLQGEFAPFLVEGESLQAAFQVVRDQFVFTDRRLILVDRQGVTGRKVEYMTIPYSSIVRFSKESAGMLDLDAELKLWIKGEHAPLVKEFRKDGAVNDVYRVLSQAVLGRVETVRGSAVADSSAE